MMRRRAMQLAIVALLCMASLYTLWQFLGPHPRRQWKDRAVAEVAGDVDNVQWRDGQIETIGRQVARQSMGTWFTTRIALMADGQWIVFRQECVKRDALVGDIFVGKASNGTWYYSSYHFCSDMASVMIDLQPSDLDEFITSYHLKPFDGQSDEALKKTWPPR